jgi:hypothetical protein
MLPRYSKGFALDNLRNTRGELFSFLLINENFINLTYSGENKLHVDREKTGFEVENQVMENKDNLAHHIKEFHSFKSILDFKQKVYSN